MELMYRTARSLKLLLSRRDRQYPGLRKMNLIVRIPEPAAAACPDVLILARLAPPFTMEGQGQDRTCVAIFTDLPESLDLAVRLASTLGALRA